MDCTDIIFYKKIPIKKVERLDHIEVSSVLGNKNVLRVFYSTNKHIRIPNYSSDTTIIKMEIEKRMT